MEKQMAPPGDGGLFYISTAAPPYREAVGLDLGNEGDLIPVKFCPFCGTEIKVVDALPDQEAN
jgi:hypothetical protein